MRVIHPSAFPPSPLSAGPFLAQDNVLQALLVLNFLQYQLSSGGPYSGLAQALMTHAQAGNALGPQAAVVRVGPGGEVSFQARTVREGLEAMRGMSRQLPKDDWRQQHLARAIKDLESRLRAQGTV